MAIAIEDHKIAYMALPKAGCSSVKGVLSSVDPQFATKATEFKDADGHDLLHAVYQTRRFRPHRWRGYDDYWRFCIVRDPTERVLSSYMDRVVSRRELHNSRKIKRGRIKLPPDPDPNFFFQNLNAYSQASGVIKHHTLPARLFLGPGVNAYDAVYRIEDMNSCFVDISAKTGQTVESKRLNRTPTKLMLDDLSSDTQGALAAYLAQDYADLSQWYDSPFE